MSRTEPRGRNGVGRVAFAEIILLPGYVFS